MNSTLSRSIGDQWDVPASHGHWAPFSRIWDPPTWHFLDLEH